MRLAKEGAGFATSRRIRRNELVVVHPLEQEAVPFPAKGGTDGRELRRGRSGGSGLRQAQQSLDAPA